MNGVAPLVPVAVLSTMDYTTPQAFCDAVNALYDQGYVYTFDVVKGTGESWIGFTGNWIKTIAA